MRQRDVDNVSNAMNTIYWHIFYYFTVIYFFVFIIIVSYKFDSSCLNATFYNFCFCIILLSLSVFILEVKKIMKLMKYMYVTLFLLIGSILGSLMTGPGYIVRNQSNNCTLLDYVVGTYIFFWIIVICICFLIHVFR